MVIGFRQIGLDLPAWSLLHDSVVKIGLNPDSLTRSEWLQAEREGAASLLEGEAERWKDRHPDQWNEDDGQLELFDSVAL